MSAGIVLTAALAVTLAGCSGASMPQQTPKPTISSGSGIPTPAPSVQITPGPAEPSEADIAAAKAAFSDYVNASQRLDYRDTSTWDAVTPYVTEARSDIEQQSYAEFQELGLHKEGVSGITLLELSGEQYDGADLWLDVCMDVSDVDYVDDEGQTWIPPNDADLIATLVGLVFETEREVWLVDRLSPREEGPEC